MQQLFDIFLKTGLRPFAMYSETAHLEKEFTRSDITTMLILSLRGEQPMSVLATELGAPLSSMTSIAKRLERKGIIKRKTSAQDQRVTLVMLTDEGKIKAEESMSIMENMLERVQEALSQEELEQFVKLVLKIARVFQSPDRTSTNNPSNQSVKRIKIDD